MYLDISSIHTGTQLAAEPVKKPQSAAAAAEAAAYRDIWPGLPPVRRNETLWQAPMPCRRERDLPRAKPAGAAPETEGAGAGTESDERRLRRQRAARTAASIQQAQEEAIAAELEVESSPEHRDIVLESLRQCVLTFACSPLIALLKTPVCGRRLYAAAADACMRQQAGLRLWPVVSSCLYCCLGCSKYAVRFCLGVSILHPVLAGSPSTSRSSGGCNTPLLSARRWSRP